MQKHEAALQAASQCIALRVRRLSRLVLRHYEHALREAGGQSLNVTPKGRDLLTRAIPEWKKAQLKVMAMLGSDAVSRLDGMIAAMVKS